MEKVVEIKSCKNCGVQFEITDKDLEFYDKVSPVFGGRKYGIPSPTHCPDCRQQRRLAFRNRRSMYKRTCDATGKPLISQYSPDSKAKVYHTRIWESDKFDALQYARSFDFNRAFFEQIQELFHAVPMPHLAVVESTLENAEYVNGANHVKSSYLSNNLVGSEAVYYSEAIYSSSDCVDCYDLVGSSVCYECFKSTNLNSCIKVSNSDNCSFSQYLEYCKNCNFCFGCVNLINKNYCILNKQYSKEEYEEKLKECLGNMEYFMTLYAELLKSSPVLFAKITNSPNCVGDNIMNSKDCKNSYDIRDGENICHSQFIVGNNKDIHDASFWGDEISMCYEVSATGMNSHKILFSLETYYDSSNNYYCLVSYGNVKNCFACVGLRNKEYCIFNKQYTKEEYELLVAKIIEHMQQTGERGEFFPISMSFYGYNESDVMSDFPLTKEQALSKGYNWLDQVYHVNIPDGIEKVDARNLPSSIKEVDDSILNKAILCEVTGKPYRIVRAELEFYRKHNIALPKRCPDQRHLDRLAKRNPRKLWKRTCDCSNCASNNNSNGPAVFKTTYSPDRPEKVYCEVCYNKEVYG